MATVTIRPAVKLVNHTSTCTTPRKCECPREFIDGKWEYDIFFEWPSGNPFRKQRRVPLPAGVPKSRAEKWAWAHYEDIVKKGEESLLRKKEEDRALTVAQFKDEYLRFQSRRKSTGQKGSTDYAREGIFRNHIEELFGEVKLKDITVRHLIELKEYLAEEEYADKTRNNILSVFSTMLKAAKALQHISDLPFDEVGIAKVDFTKPPPFYDEDEMNRLITAAMKDAERSALPLILTGFDAGLRDGELRGLAPYDIKWGQKQIRVERQVWGIDKVGTPKSGYGRTIDVPDRLLAVLKEHGKLKGDRIFLRNDGKPWTPKTIRRLMKRLQRAAGLEPKGGIHILRHTFCTRLASNRVDIRVIKEMAGHSDVKTTMRYLHVVKGATAAAAATLNTPLPKPESGDSWAPTLQAV